MPLLHRALPALVRSCSCLTGAAVPLASGVSAPIRQLRLQDSPRRSGREQGRGGNSSFARAGELYLALGISALLSPHHAACAGGCPRQCLLLPLPVVIPGFGNGLAEDQQDTAGHGKGWRLVPAGMEHQSPGSCFGCLKTEAWLRSGGCVCWRDWKCRA